MNTKDKIIFSLTIGVLSLLGAIVIGELYLTHRNQGEISTEIITLIKMSITGLIGIIAGYMGGKSSD
jgi:cellobiose-specific phosphotransferase system component IIC